MLLDGWRKHSESLKILYKHLANMIMQLSGEKDTVHKNMKIFITEKIVCIWSSKNLSEETASFSFESHESLPYKGYFLYLEMDTEKYI